MNQTVDNSKHEEVFNVFKATAALEPLPEINHIINGLIPERSLTLPVGEPGSKKTYATLSLCACVASGTEWIGMPTEKGTTLYIDEESGKTRLLHRVNAVLKGYGLEAEQVENFNLVSGVGFNLRDKKGISRLESLIDTTRPVLVVIDALADVIPGADENSVKDIQPAFMALRSIAEKYQTAIIVIHHTNKSGGYRGSSAMKGSVDILLTLDSDDRRNSITFQSEKMRDGEPVKFSAIPQFGEGTFYLKKSSVKEGGKFSPTQSKVIQALQDYGCLTIKQIVEATGIPHESVKKAVKDLQNSNTLVRVDGGGKGVEAEYGLLE